MFSKRGSDVSKLLPPPSFADPVAAALTQGKISNVKDRLCGIAADFNNAANLAEYIRPQIRKYGNAAIQDVLLAVNAVSFEAYKKYLNASYVHFNAASAAASSEEIICVSSLEDLVRKEIFHISLNDVRRLLWVESDCASVEFLLDSYFVTNDVTHTSDEAKDLLRIAILSSNVSAVQRLLHLGVSPNLSRDDVISLENSSLALAIGVSAENYLPAYSAPADRKNVEAQSIAIFKLLLAYGADVDKVCSEGHPLFLALDSNASADIVSLLVHAGTNIFFKNTQGFTAIENCFEHLSHAGFRILDNHRLLLKIRMLFEKDQGETRILNTPDVAIIIKSLLISADFLGRRNTKRTDLFTCKYLLKEVESILAKPQPHQQLLTNRRNNLPR